MTVLNAEPAQRRNFRDWVRRIDDANLLRVVFYGLLAGVIVTVFLDYRAMALDPQRDAILPGISTPVLPPVSPSRTQPGGDDTQKVRQRPDVTTPNELLRDAMRFTLEPGGVLQLQGTIAPGSADAFSAEVSRIGEYVKRIELDSPGGSVQDALAMAKLIREKGYETHVPGGKLCASSCPIVFSGGKKRKADKNAAIGLHQVFTPGEQSLLPGQAVSTAQSVTAEITRHLSEMDVDPALWLHALDTPPDRLYYLSAEEMKIYRLVTG